MFIIISALLGLNLGFNLSDYKNGNCEWYKLIIAIAAVICWAIYTYPNYK